MVGDKLIQGKDDFGEALERIKSNKAVELIIDHVATHGKTGAINGTKNIEKMGKPTLFETCTNSAELKAPA